MTYHTGDSFMDQWLNRQMRCDKNRLNRNLQVLHPCTKSSAELFGIDQSFSTESRCSSVSLLMLVLLQPLKRWTLVKKLKLHLNILFLP